MATILNIRLNTTFKYEGQEFLGLTLDTSEGAYYIGISNIEFEGKLFGFVHTIGDPAEFIGKEFYGMGTEDFESHEPAITPLLSECGVTLEDSRLLVVHTDVRDVCLAFYDTKPDLSPYSAIVLFDENKSTEEKSSAS